MHAFLHIIYILPHLPSRDEIMPMSAIRLKKYYMPPSLQAYLPDLFEAIDDGNHINYQDANK